MFLDDYSIFSDSFESCLEKLGKVLEQYVETNIVLNWENCYFMVKEGIFLRHKILGLGIQFDQQEVEVIARLNPLISVKGVISFLGHVSFMRDFSQIAHPL